MDDNRRFYDAKAEAYANEWYDNDLLLPTVRDFMSLFEVASPSVLDLGCGPGNETRRLAREGARAVGLDYSAESIRIARERNPGIRFHEMSYFDIAPDLGKFDGVFACSSLIHLGESRIGEVLDILRPLLSPGAIFMNVFMFGKGQKISYPEIDGAKLERVVELVEEDRAKAIFARRGFSFVREGHLDPSLRGNWANHVYRLGGGDTVG